MDCQDRSAGKRVSVLQGDEFFHKRIISRQSSVGFSSRIYFRSAEGVPFKWETQPGKPKKQPEDEVIPPPSPSPAMQSLGLPKPIFEEPKGSTPASRFWFWKKTKKNQQSKKVQAVSRESKVNVTGSDKSERFEYFCSSDGEFVASPLNSSSSSSLSSSSSSLNGPSLRSRHQSPARDLLDGSFSCAPWNISTILISIARRV